ncbi:hypothetical protein LCGC14_1905840 [marine sediment metagenome]|uniref:Uncharacterized protein n=1 Tax=marine sediment metagenome TaxID=412755 RepID=A0A0F9ITC6_9ZZZZ
MAINPQVLGQALAQPVQSFIDISSKRQIFGSKFNDRESSLDPTKFFENYLGRVHHRYKNMDTTNIENIVNRLLQEKNPTFMNHVREKISLRDTFLNRFVEAKTPLGEVLQELQNSQESPNRKLLSRKTFDEAEKEAGELTKKERALATEKRQRKSNEISHLLKRQTAGATKIGSEFQVNTYITGYQSEPSVTSLSNGQFVVTWKSSDGQDGDGNGVYGQVFNADGRKNGSEFQVNTYTTDDQDSPSVASLTNGQFVVTWDSLGQDGDGWGIYGQIFNADGTKSGSEFQVNTYTANFQDSSSIASLNNDKFVVTWKSLGQDGSGYYGIYGQIFNADGTKSGSEFQINTYVTDRQINPAIASLTNGQFVVAWESDGQDGDAWGVYGQVFNADGTKNGSEFPVNTYTTNDQSKPSVASLGNGQFVVTWDSFEQDGDVWGVYGQIFNADGTKSGSEFLVNTETTGHQSESSIASLSNGLFVVAWLSDQGDSSDGVYGQVFNADGTKNGSEFPVNTDNMLFHPSAASLSNDKFIITWSSVSGNSSVYGQIFGTDIISSSSSSTRQSESPTDVASGAERQTGIALTALSWMATTVKGALGY